MPGGRSRYGHNAYMENLELWNDLAHDKQVSQEIFRLSFWTVIGNLLCKQSDTPPTR